MKQKMNSTYYPEVQESDKNVSLKAMFRGKKEKKNQTKSNNKSTWRGKTSEKNSYYFASLGPVLQDLCVVL